MDERGRACVPGKRVNSREEEKINRLSICIQLIWSHTYADASFTIDDISAPWTGGEEILEIIWVEKYNDPSVQRRQLIDEEPSNSSFAIERAIDRNRAFAILFINVLLSFLGYIARNRRILISVLLKSSFDSRSGIFGARAQKGERKK